MATMLNGAAVMDGALLLIAANCVTLAMFDPLAGAHAPWNARLDTIGVWSCVCCVRVCVCERAQFWVV